MPSAAALPRARDRVVGVDLARMLALLGMFAAHLVPASPDGETVEPLFQVVAGRSSALFAVLAGVGIALVTRDASTDPRTARARLAVRAGVIAVLGLVLGSFDSGVAVILTCYGVLFLCALPVLTWRASSLAVLAAGWALVSPVVSLLLRREIVAPPKIVPNLLSLAEPGTLVTELLLTGYYPVLTWATYLFAGMAVGRLDLRRRLVGPGLVVVGALLALLALVVSNLVTSSASVRAVLLQHPRRPVDGWDELVVQMQSGFFGIHPTGTAWWLGVWAPHSGSVVDLVHTTGTALLVLGLALWLVGSTPSVPWRVIAGAGSMTLTLYSTHVLVLATALGVHGTMPFVIHSLFALVVGAMFAAVPVKGPLEQLVSYATRLVPAVGSARTRR
ncbi:hypothetical protein GCM10009584_25220 [Ornithinimicrobium humiphilum]|uniref:Putative membrane protein YeiB n=1 Tax=Ornithinimicrobium humiphilum TaxID=125288 RepID=A0A543KM81_9MICO|nr:heparan-alpha-glucosaminide N-acetyltransferase domain-containing protein [Ornithinimicrobium humiphilum]TQM96188.1 putative membrane protein YeiB [Ornithinimicrobium humiphilum]